MIVVGAMRRALRRLRLARSAARCSTTCCAALPAARARDDATAAAGLRALRRASSFARRDFRIPSCRRRCARRLPRAGARDRAGAPRAVQLDAARRSSARSRGECCSARRSAPLHRCSTTARTAGGRTIDDYVGIRGSVPNAERRRRRLRAAVVARVSGRVLSARRLSRRGRGVRRRASTRCRPARSSPPDAWRIRRRVAGDDRARGAARSPAPAIAVALACRSRSPRSRAWCRASRRLRWRFRSCFAVALVVTLAALSRSSFAACRRPWLDLLPYAAR